MASKKTANEDAAHASQPAESPAASELKLSDIKIDPEFRDHLPHLPPETLAALKASIKADGFREPIVVWKQEKIVVDGHNRLKIWKNDYNSDETRAPRIVEMSFPDRAAAMVWMLQNQAGRRNLSDIDRMHIAYQMRASITATAKANKQSKKSLNSDNSHTPHDKLARLAEIAGVSRATMAEYACVRDQGAAEVSQAVQERQLPVYKAAEIAKLDASEQPDALQRAIAERHEKKTQSKKRTKSAAKPTSQAACAEHAQQLASQIDEFCDAYSTNVDSPDDLFEIREALQAAIERLQEMLQIADSEVDEHASVKPPKTPRSRRERNEIVA